MAISSFSGSTGGASALNGFHVYTGTNGYTTFTFEDEQPAGAYYITSQMANDYVYDIYVASEDGTFAGYTTSRLLVATAPIKNVVIYGGTAEDLVVFDYKTTATEQVSGQVDGGVAPFALSVSDSTLVDIDDTTTVTGGNFANDVTVTFTGSDLVERSAKAVVKNSASEIVVTRPDDLPPDHSPYTLTFVNPGVPSPTDARNVLTDVITAGGYPIWNTPTTIYWTLNNSTSFILSAGDPDASDVDYELISGSLFAGFSLDQETGAITGDESALSEGDSTTFTIKATDDGGNSTNRTFTMFANELVQWVTPAGSLGSANLLGNNIFQLEHNDGGTATNVVYSLEAGSLPTGMVLNDAGQISGQPTAEGTFTFTVGITDDGGFTNTREFFLETTSEVYSWYFAPFPSAAQTPIVFLNDYSL